jgi:hypothetical protein
MPDLSHTARLKGMQHEYHPCCAICAPQNPAGLGLEFRLPPATVAGPAPGSGGDVTGHACSQPQTAGRESA